MQGPSKKRRSPSLPVEDRPQDKRQALPAAGPIEAPKDDKAASKPAFSRLRPDGSAPCSSLMTACCSCCRISLCECLLCAVSASQRQPGMACKAMHAPPRPLGVDQAVQGFPQPYARMQA